MDNSNRVGELIEHLKNNDVTFAPGLSEEQLKEIERYARGRIPAELRLLLSKVVPISSVGAQSFARWDLGAEHVFNEWNTFFYDMLIWDIKEGEYWHASFGAKPADIDAAFEQAKGAIDGRAGFVPLSATRDALFAGIDDGPVVDYYGVLDSTGWHSMYDFFYSLYPKENVSREGAVLAQDVPFWSDIFGWKGY